MKLRPATIMVPLVLLLLGVPSAAMAALLPGPNVNVSNAGGAQSEVGIAANPTDPTNLVAVSNNIADLSRLGVWFSFDSGVTWTANFLDENEDAFGANDSRFDPNVAFDSDGNVYVVYSITGTGNRLLLAQSTDGGQNFTQVTTVTTDAGGNNLHTAMVTSRSDGGAGTADDVLVVWARVQAGGESIEAALSLDAGATFPTTNNNINDALQRTFLPWAAVDGSGNFHVVWEVNQGGGAGVILHDTLNGNTLADGAVNNQVTTVQITDFAAATSKIPAQPDRGLFSVATVDVDRVTGRVYVSYTDRPNTASNDTDIFVRFSNDNGATWTLPTQVNDDTTTTSQFLPRLALDQTTGFICAIWYDARNDTANNQQVDVFISASMDGGLTWSPNQRLTGARSDESTANAARNGNNYGEYFGLTANNGLAHAVWTDARAANFTAGTNEDVYTAMLSFVELLKTVTSGPDIDADNKIDVVVEVGQLVTTEYDFTMTYSNPGGPPVLIVDTAPAEWIVTEVGGLPVDVDECGEFETVFNGFGSADVFKNGTLGRKCRSSTKIFWTPDPDGGQINVVMETRQSPGKKNVKFAPTSCGPLFLNSGLAKVFEVDPATGEPLRDPVTGELLPPLFTAEPLVLAAVEDLNGGGVVPDGSGDEDGDGRTDIEEVRDFGSDPCIASVDLIIDRDGIASEFIGPLSEQEVVHGDPLTPWPTSVGFGPEGIDGFDNDASGDWSPGDDIHLEDPNGSCSTASRDAFFDDNVDNQDCRVRDDDLSLADGQPVDCDFETGTFCGGFLTGPSGNLTFDDTSGSTDYNNAEDIVLDVNKNGIFD